MRIAKHLLNNCLLSWDLDSKETAVLQHMLEAYRSPHHKTGLTEVCVQQVHQLPGRAWDRKEGCADLRDIQSLQRHQQTWLDPGLDPAQILQL